MSYIVH